MNHVYVIEQGIEQQLPLHEIVRKVYLTYPTYAFINDEEIQYDILNEISIFFKIPINNIQVTGSGKIGRSLHKHTEFNAKISDLDISIISSELFIELMETVYDATDGHSDGSKFPVNTENGVSHKATYLAYLNKGLFRVDLMPTCDRRADVRNFFSKLSTKYSSKFKNINAGIYLSQHFFEMKQRSAIKEHIKYLKKAI